MKLIGKCAVCKKPVWMGQRHAVRCTKSSPADRRRYDVVHAKCQEPAH